METGKRRERLLFLVADTGGGHRASAAAVERQLADRFPERFEVHTLDPFPSAGPVSRQSERLYAPLTQHADWLWGALWHASNSKFAVSLLQRTSASGLAKRIAAAVSTWQPQTVISFHPLLNHPAAAACRGTATPLITVVTDLVDIHATWICSQASAIVVPTPAGFDRCRRAGIVAERLFDFGLAVDASFCQPPPQAAEKERLQTALGIPAGRFTLLLCGGADGTGDLPARARAILDAGLPVTVVAICGRNRGALRQLQALAAGYSQLVVRGFVDNMADWMRACDLAITKGGPGTIAEALCCGLPLLITWFLPGQERANVEWVVGRGAGRYTPSSAQLTDTIAELARPGSRALATMRAAVAAAARPQAAADIADLIAAVAGRRQ